ncbi:hypothetical protein [Amycolatopsis jiangsuensis]|uniref:Uncharacterized protein n=1 Tax=Amycolatopsis jiangsuensis TaxID=1181879 RepID=A0A840IMG5_9PSEU|nr:hypothetical protein [Amycolatopsis jiangsuensis]MBB4683526.1 hypothetical protein [Amycolatopsis jiangsuensis]
MTDLQGGAGWNNGFVLAGGHTVPAAPNDRGQQNDLVSDVYFSRDGAHWTEAKPDGLHHLGHSVPVAGYRGAAYVLGSSTSTAAIRRIEDRKTWRRTRLAGSKPGEALTAVAAGAHGVVVVGFDRPISVLDNDFIDNRGFDSLRVWHSADGKAFTGPETVEAEGLYDGYVPQVTADADGFTIFGIGKDSSDTIMFSSADDTGWTEDGPGPMTGDEDWIASHDVSPGMLPDSNVDKPEKQHILHVTAWRGWFVATGDSAGAAGVWLSRDAARWDRVPVKANGFDTAGSMITLVNESSAFLSATPRSGTGGVKMWKNTA